MKPSFPIGLAAAIALAAVAGSIRAADEYLPGGPLAGRNLPRNPLDRKEVVLYPGSVEHWRSDWLHHVPKRSLFDQQSLLKNWVAPGIPTAGPLTAEIYASPVYKVGNWTVEGPTGRFLEPVPVIRCRPGNPVFRLPLGILDPGLYAVRIIGAVETAKVRPFREPLYVALTVNDGAGGEIHRYRLRIGYCDEFYSVAEIYFQAPEKREYRAELSVDAGSTVDLLVHNITLDDVLAGAVREAIKKSGPTLCDPAEKEVVRSSVSAGKLGNLAKFRCSSSSDRLARDEAVWKTMPPLNAQDGFLPGYRLKTFKGITEGVGDQDQKQIEARCGKWELAGLHNIGYQNGLIVPTDPTQRKAFLVNQKLQLEYTTDDWYARKPLPDPYPYPDDGTGLFTPDPAVPNRGKYWSPIAEAVSARVRAASALCEGSLHAWWITGNEEFARDAAVALIGYAWRFPTLDAANALGSLMQEPGGGNYWRRTRQRVTYDHFSQHYGSQGRWLRLYDQLFPYIQGNEDLAKSVSRFVPWVKTSRDLIRLLDVYLVQTEAKRVMRYQYPSPSSAVVDAATVLADRRVTDPWMDWVFTGWFNYPMDPAGLQDLLISSYDREGCQFIGLTFYAQGSGARKMATLLDPYLRAGGNPKYDLSDPIRYPKPLAQCDWQLGILVGGLEFLRIADVDGPDKFPGATLPALEDASRSGWKISADPRFAWLLKNVYGRKLESDAEWQKIGAAADAVQRAPWLDNRSRVLANWAGILETGRAHDDYRFRRACYVRAGIGTGHEHNDALDLQVVAHGLPMTIDGGQRSAPAYSSPKDRVTRTHNTVEVDGYGTAIGEGANGWIQTLSDGEGVRYLAANAGPPPGSTLYRRQVALIDVDEGSGSRPLRLDEQKPGAALPKNVVTGNSYVFDVFRVAGGQLHSYGFHGPVDDDFQWNATGVQPVAEPAGLAKEDTEEKPRQGVGDETDKTDASKEEESPAAKPEQKEPKPRARGAGRDVHDDVSYLALFHRAGDSKMAGNCPETFQATWRYTRDGKTGSEQQMLGRNFAADAPRKFTRLTLLNAAGMRALRADVVETPASPVQYRFTQVMLQRRAQEGDARAAKPKAAGKGKGRAGGLESAFTAIVEPYVGESFVESAMALSIADNESDARRAVAAEVKTKNGHTDVCFADGRPEKTREIRGQRSAVSGQPAETFAQAGQPSASGGRASPRAADLRVSGEFAYYSVDAQGLRRASLVGGTLLDGPGLTLKLDRRERTAKVVKVDYSTKTLWIDAAWPAACGGKLFEIGQPDRRTSYTSREIRPDGPLTRMTVTRGADLYRSPLRKFDPDAGLFRGAVDIPTGLVVNDLAASNDDATKFFRATHEHGTPDIKIVEGKLTRADLAPSNVVRYWEYGPGDIVRQSSSVVVQRMQPGIYRVETDADMTMSVPASAIESSADLQAWKPMNATRVAGRCEVVLQANDLGNNPIYLRMTP